MVSSLIENILQLFKKKPGKEHICKEYEIKLDKKHENYLCVSLEGLCACLAFIEIDKKKHKGTMDEVMLNSLRETIILKICMILNEKEDAYWPDVYENKDVLLALEKCSYKNVDTYFDEIKTERDWRIAHWDFLSDELEKTPTVKNLRPSRVIFKTVLQDMVNLSKKKFFSETVSFNLPCENIDCVEVIYKNEFIAD